jgi:O-antigen/teichoic acid export membrane protein/glycosyltransferase involved in cell wall biosynthesis
MAIQFFASNGATAANFILVILLSRILTPAEIGIFSMAAVVASFSHVFRDFGVVAFIKRQKDLTPEVLRAAMGVLMVASWSIAIVLYLLSSIVAEYYEQPGVERVLQVLSAGFLFIPFGSIPQAVLSRDLQAKKLAFVALISTVTYFFATLILAFSGFSYMTMAWANLINIIVSSIAYTAVRPRGIPWLPSFNGWGQVANFGIGATLTSSLTAIDQALGELILGKLGTPTMVGLLSRANSTVNILSQIAKPTIDFTALPYLAKVFHSGSGLNVELQRAIAYLTGLYWPALIATALFSREIVEVLFGIAWLDANAAIPWLCLAAGVCITFSLLRPTLTGIGHPYWMAMPIGYGVVLKIALALALYDGTLVSFARSIAIAELLAIPAYLWVAHRFVGMTLMAWVSAVRQSAVVGIITGLAMSALFLAIAPLTSPILRLFIVAIVWTTIWVFAIYTTRHPFKNELSRAFEFLKNVGRVEQPSKEIINSFHSSAATPSGSSMVSVVIPVRNCKAYIHEAIDSILVQAYSNVEIIVIDDGSDDFDYLSLHDYDQRIKVIRLEGVGVSRARNTGMKLAQGELIAFLDADDVWFPGKLSAQIAYLEKHPEVGVVFGGFIKWNQELDGTFLAPAILMQDCSGLDQADSERSGWLYTRLLMGLLVGMNTAIIRKKLYHHLGGFDESLRIGEDYDYWLRASRITQIHSLAGPVALYRIHKRSATSHADPVNHLSLILKTAEARWGLSSPDGEAVLQKNFKLRIAASEFDHGYRHFWTGNAHVAQKAFWKALRGGYLLSRSIPYCIISWLKSFLQKSA